MVLTTIIENFDYEGILLLSTHLIGEVERALDRVLFMSHGKIVVDETVDDIREKHHMGVEDYFTEVI